MISPNRLACLLALTPVVACASSPRTPADPPGPSSGREPVDEIAWGTPRTALEQRFPQATSDQYGLTWEATYAGKPAAIDLFFDDGGAFSGWRAVFAGTFESMDRCGETWRELRAVIDRRYGPSQSDNLAAYWDSVTGYGELTCSPLEEGGAALELDFSQSENDVEY